jgi:fructosamine-3-kinase
VSLADAVRAATGREPRAAERVGGGDINDAYRVRWDDGTLAFVKTRADAAPGEYAAEAAGLRWLAEPGALGVPAVLGVLDEPGARLLALEWLEPGPPGDEAALGRGLAAVHAAGAPAFGGPRPARIGALALPNDPAPSWGQFFARRRLLPLLAPARDRGALSRSGAEAVERVCDRIDDLAGPPEPPARLHGDLWSGNVLAGRDGRPWLIDPAAYGGHREVDLAMMRLFGGFSERVFSAYDEALPLAPGASERVALYQLYPLMVHVNLFGGGYAGSVERALARYA